MMIESTQLEISLLVFEVLKHPPYSPDLAPMDFCVFPELKAQLRGIRFDSADDLTKQAQAVVTSFTEKWYVETYSKWTAGIRNASILEVTMWRQCDGRWTLINVMTSACSGYAFHIVLLQIG